MIVDVPVTGDTLTDTGLAGYITLEAGNRHPWIRTLAAEVLYWFRRKNNG